VKRGGRSRRKREEGKRKNRKTDGTTGLGLVFCFFLVFLFCRAEGSRAATRKEGIALLVLSGHGGLERWCPHRGSEGGEGGEPDHEGDFGESNRDLEFGCSASRAGWAVLAGGE